jgi:hypothetical protein
VKLKITISPYAVYPAVSTPAFILADDSVSVITGAVFPNGAGGQAQDGFLGECERQVQAVPLVRGSYQQVIPRFNLKHAIPLNVIRVHDSERDAMIFVATHIDVVPASGLLQVTATCSDGVVNLWMPNAVVGPIRRTKHTGVRWLWNYQIFGNGPWLTTKPATS